MAKPEETTMKRLRALVMRIGGLFGRTSRDDGIAEELESHLQMHIDDNLRAGMTAEQARRQAMLRLGGVQATSLAYRDRGTIPWIEHLLQDVRFSIRLLRKHLGFTSTAILMLALGISASVAIFAFVDAALIKPLPYRDPARLVGVFEKTSTFPLSNLSYPDYVDWKAINKTLSSLDLYQPTGFTFSGPDGAQPLMGARVSDGFFKTLGITPILGRDFAPGEDLPAAAHVALLSYGSWQTRFNGDPSVVGRVLTLNGDATTIIGVLPASFHFSPVEPAELFRAFHPFSECDLRRSCHSSYGIARLKDGVSVQAALSDVESVARLLEQRYPGSNLGQGGTVTPLGQFIGGDLRPILLVLLAGSVLLLLIASVNVASLLLVRSEGRRREIALRHALGASTARVFAQFVTEALVLVGAGAVIGVIAAYWAMRMLTTLIPAAMFARMTYLHDLGLNPRVLWFAAGITVLATILCALTPMARLSGGGIRAGLAEGGRGSAGQAWRRLGSKLVILELATAMVLLVGAGLLGKSLYQLLRVNIGFQPDHLALLDVVAPRGTYGKQEQQVALQRQILSQVTGLPGVQSVAVTGTLPVGFNGNTTWFRIIGKPWNGEHNDTPEREISIDYFKTIGAKLVRGRPFEETDDLSTQQVIIVNQAFARHFFPGEDAIGHEIAELRDNARPIRIVGIVEDIREGPLDAAIPPVLYMPFNQSPDLGFSLVVRTAQTEDTLLPTLAATIRGLDRDIVTRSGSTMNERINNSMSAYLHRSSAWLVGGFAGVAFLLSIVGLYGVVAYSVSQRNREIGVRMALGAHRGTVYRLILREAGGLTLIGVAIGAAGSVGAASLMSGLLFAVKSWDASTLAAVAGVLVAAALLASFIPARRAASVNPVEALRAE
jgi:macrolide transport system ATP-binding/permease protein